MDEVRTLVEYDDQVPIQSRSLVSEADWLDLIDFLKEAIFYSPALAQIVEGLKSAGAKSLVIENHYLDRDVSDEFKAFYATLFRRYRRHARRFHFFTTDVSSILAQEDVKLRATQLVAAGEKRGYLGFLVLRPVRSAPVGRAVLDSLTVPAEIYANIEIQADYEVHLLGAELKVAGMPFMQQDARITACAQATIWMAGRHFHTRHRGPWFSSVQVADAAASPTDDTLAMSLPAGAGGLSATNMVRALRDMGRFPYMYTSSRTVRVPVDDENDTKEEEANADDGLQESDQQDDEKGRPEKWKKKYIWDLNPADIIARYVESGIPVILGLSGLPNASEDHAVVAIGTTFRVKQGLTFRSKRPTVAEFIPYFLVHDDQRGMNIKMPVTAGEINEETDYSVMDNVTMIMVPLPDKVFILAEAAEVKARTMLEEVLDQYWPDLKSEHQDYLGSSAELGNRVAGARYENRIITRTYLTFGWKYKDWIVKNLCPNYLKAKIAEHELPKMVWVTEFSLADDINKLDPADRRVFGHCAIDSTASEIDKPIVLHVPGFVWLWSQKDPQFYTVSEEEIFLIADDCTYWPRSRPLLCRKGDA